MQYFKEIWIWIRLEKQIEFHCPINDLSQEFITMLLSTGCEASNTFSVNWTKNIEVILVFILFCFINMIDMDQAFSYFQVILRYITTSWLLVSELNYSLN